MEYREDKHGVMKKYRSLQGGLFHLVMVFFSAYFGVININWVNLDLDAARLGLAIGDDFSIWIRVSSISLGIFCVILKQIRIHWKTASLRFKTKDPTTDDESNSSENYQKA